jgi:glycosyltransferase involved in cell wall biosynthesis
MRIEMVLPGLIYAGMETVVAQLTQDLARRGHDVGITCIEFEGPLGEKLRGDGVRLTLVPAPGLRTIPFPTQLARWFATLRPDVVHAHSGAWLKAARAAHLARVPRVVHTVHGLDDPEPWYGPLLMWWAALYTSAIAAVSDPLADYLKRVAHVPSGRIHVVPNGVDTDRFRPGPKPGILRTRYALEPHACVFGHVGRLVPVKNHALLFKAFARVLKRHPHIALVLIGDGVLRASLEELARQLGIDRRVHFFGETSDPSDVYREFDAFLLPSLAEGTSMSILEAMATGLPVVGSAVGGTPALLAHGEAGLLVPPNDADALAAALDTIASNAEIRRQLGLKARHRAVSHYSHEHVASRYERLYAASTTSPAN